MKKPQVLIFIDWYLPGTKAGGPVRSCANLVGHLSEQIDFSIVTTDTDYTETESYKDIEPDQWVQREDGTRVWYCSQSRIGKPAFLEILNEREYDAYYINGIYSRFFSILPLQLLKGSNRKVVVAVRGMLAEGPMKFGAFKKRAFLLFAKLIGLYKNVIFQATKPVEVDDIKKHVSPKARIETIPNLPRVLGQELQTLDKQVGELNVICLARVAIEKNNIFAIQQLAEIKGKVRLDLCGSIYDQDYWRECKSAIEKLPNNVEVQLIDVVPGDEVPDLLSKYHLMFLPTHGENFGHVIFEALSVGRPVLISNRTPWLGLDQHKAGVDLPLEEPARFKETLQEFTDMDQTEFDVWCKGSYDYVLRYLAQDDTTLRNTSNYSVNERLQGRRSISPNSTIPLTTSTRHLRIKRILVVLH